MAREERVSTSFDTCSRWSAGRLLHVQPVTSGVSLVVNTAQDKFVNLSETFFFFRGNFGNSVVGVLECGLCS